MRELKFRVWDKEAKHFCGNLKKYLLDTHTSELQVANYSDLYEEWYYSENMDTYYIIQQYTGLKDKNGKEIYESDILKIHNIDANTGEDISGIFEVYFDQSFCQFRLKHHINSYTMSSVQIYGEVIGNLFENKELLN